MKYLFKWVILTILFVCGIFCLILVLGEENPYDPIPFWKYVLLKAAGFVGCAICIVAGLYLHESGFLPNIPEE